MNFYSEKQLLFLMKHILSGMGNHLHYAACQDEMLPIRDVAIAYDAESAYMNVTLDLGNQEGKAVYALPLSEPPVSQQTYTEEVLRTYAGEDTRQDKLTLGALGLAGEAGEVIDLIKKWRYQGHRLNYADVLDEVGDVLWYLALICSAFGRTLDDAIGANVQKMQVRYPDGFSAERSLN